MILYHITKRMHVPSILAKGIIPGHRRGLLLQKYKLPHVYLTNNIRHIIDNQAGPKWCKRWDPVVLEIDDIEVSPVKYYSGGTYTLSNFEFITSKIEPKQIKAVKELNEVMHLQTTIKYAEELVGHLSKMNELNRERDFIGAINIKNLGIKINKKP